MNDQQSTVIDNHVRTMMKLLLGDKPAKPALAFFAGPEVDLSMRMNLSSIGTDTQIDIVYFAFRIDDDGLPLLADIEVFLPRDRACFGWTGCILTTVPGQSRAVLVSPSYSGYFSILQDEILQHPKRPEWMDRRQNGYVPTGSSYPIAAAIRGERSHCASA